MNNTNSIKIKITMVVMALIVSMGMVAQVSALTDIERYHEGWLDSYTGDGNKQLDMAFLGIPAFQVHSDAYKNGYIGALDQHYNLRIPYVEYHSDTLDGSDDPNAGTSLTPHYMGISVSVKSN